MLAADKAAVTAFFVNALSAFKQTDTLLVSHKL